MIQVNVESRYGNRAKRLAEAEWTYVKRVTFHGTSRPTMQLKHNDIIARQVGYRPAKPYCESRRRLRTVKHGIRYEGIRFMRGFGWPPGLSNPVLSSKSLSNCDRIPGTGAATVGAVANIGPAADLKWMTRTGISFCGSKTTEPSPRRAVMLVKRTSVSVVVVV
jgi:hypothetical protein